MKLLFLTDLHGTFCKFSMTWGWRGKDGFKTRLDTFLADNGLINTAQLSDLSPGRRGVALLRGRGYSEGVGLKDPAYCTRWLECRCWFSVYPGLSSKPSLLS